MQEEKLVSQLPKSEGKASGKGPKTKEKKVEGMAVEPVGEENFDYSNRNVRECNQIQIYENEPERKVYLRESLKNYLLIKENMYLNRAHKIPTEDDIYQCECASGVNLTRRQQVDPNLSIDCGPKCLNSIISIECDASVCPCGIRCQNRKFQRHQNACVYPVAFGDKGFGLVAAEFIPKETFVIQYIGEVLSINSEEGKRRLVEYSKSTCTYMMRLSAKEVIDPTYKGNMARFINHSCDPNCETRKWNVRGEIEVGIISVKDIQPGEELTFDYKFDVYQTPFTRCLCGTAKCKGYLGLVPVEYTCEEWEEKIDNLPCEICGGTTESGNNQLLLCDICNNGYHTYCCEPPIETIPQGAWFCTKCKLSSHEPLQPEKPPEENAEQPPPTKPAFEKPLKTLLSQSKRLRIHYANIIKKAAYKSTQTLLRDKVKDPEEVFLTEYYEFFTFQTCIQIEVIKEFLAELKREKRDKERALSREKAYAEKLSHPSKIELTDKELSVSVQPEEDLEEEESSEEEYEDVQSSNQKVQQQQKSETKSGDEKMKQESLELFTRMLKASDLWEKSKQRVEGEREEVTKTIIPVSAIELHHFKAVQSSYVMKLFSQNNKVYFFWDNSKSHPDMFAKVIEFRIQGNKSEINLVKEVFRIMDEAICAEKKKKGFTEAVVRVPAIYLKRILGEFQKNIHHVENEFAVRTQFDKRFLTDECYGMHETAPLALKGFREDIVKARGYYQSIVSELSVYRVYMSSSEIKEIIGNLITIKQNIHPSEIRCCRDNALRDINHPFFTIYYKDKEVAFVGTSKEIEHSVALVQSEVTRNKAIVRNAFSLNYLLPICDKTIVTEVKNIVEADNKETKLIIYEPLHPRKNFSLTLISTYEHYLPAYNIMRDKIDEAQLFGEKFEHYQVQTLYQMSKYFFKYLQNYFQTKSIIFMKAWDSISSEFGVNCNNYESSFRLTKSLYIRDHELKFYILSVNRMGYEGTYRHIGLEKQDILVVLKSIVNKTLLYDSSMVFNNYQSIFNPYPAQLREFLHSYKPKTYFLDYSHEKIGDFERRLKMRILSSTELDKEGEINFPKKESVHRNDKVRPRDMKTGFSRRDLEDTIGTTHQDALPASPKSKESIGPEHKIVRHNSQPPVVTTTDRKEKE